MGAQQHKKTQERKTRHDEKNKDRMIIQRQRKGVKLRMMKKRCKYKMMMTMDVHWTNMIVVYNKNRMQMHR